MALEALPGLSLESNNQDGVAQESPIELLSPPIFTRCQEPDGSDGSVYDLEILTSSPGSLNPTDSHRLAACTLIIGAPVGKNKIRMVDGKIENLWIKDEEIATRLNNIQLLANLLSYVQKFCAGHEVPHLSSVQKADHPAWLRDFFIVAGFSRCECLKPEAGGQRYRACLKLSSSGQAFEPNASQSLSNGQVERQKEIINKDASGPVAIPVPIAPPGKEAAEAISTIRATNGTTGSSSSDHMAIKPFTKDQAMEWLSQNQEMLSPINNSRLTSMPAPNATTPQNVAAAEASARQTGPTEKSEKPTGAKRKRAEAATELQNTDFNEGDIRSRKAQNGIISEQSGKQVVSAEAQLPRFNPEKNTAEASSTGDSFTIPGKAPDTLKANGHSSSGASMTDALLAQCTKAGSKASERPVKKEPPAARSTYSPLPDSSSRTVPNAPPKTLTCYYWQTQGVCKHRDEDCTYAHYDTGTVARPPGSFRKPRSSFRYSAYGDPWSDVNGINIKGTHDSWRP